MDFKQIEQYFRRGLSNREILTLLKDVHGIKISNRTLERILSKHQLWRRKNKTDEADVEPSFSNNYKHQDNHMVTGCPNLVRLDLGTENVSVAEMQKFLHHGTQPDSTCVSLGQAPAINGMRDGDLR
ncbi:40S ribosomal protein S13 [Labeo rohita]|uniref:40S ribosomal protein S13 n=1 Tax=Labeo rohita TaxID=84645 RepID=A0ABQ8L766_LABRO|nr:40S ribosomal protein S13 [Labeo rohita]